MPRATYFESFVANVLPCLATVNLAAIAKTGGASISSKQSAVRAAGAATEALRPCPRR